MEGGREMSKEFQIALKKKKKERVWIEKENVKKGPTGQKKEKNSRRKHSINRGLARGFQL